MLTCGDPLRNQPLKIATASLLMAPWIYGRPVLYRTTFSGDPEGTVYSLTPPTSGSGAWTFTTLPAFPGNPPGTGDGGASTVHQVRGCADSFFPAGLLQSTNGAFYGPAGGPGAAVKFG